PHRPGGELLHPARLEPLLQPVHPEVKPARLGRLDDIRRRLEPAERGPLPLLQPLLLRLQGAPLGGQRLLVLSRPGLEPGEELEEGLQLCLPDETGGERDLALQSRLLLLPLPPEGGLRLALGPEGLICPGQLLG